MRDMQTDLTGEQDTYRRFTDAGIPRNHIYEEISSADIPTHILQKGIIN